MGQDPFVGEIQTFAFSYAPPGFMSCNGSLLPIAQNQALFALLGTTYGGNGVQTFGIPDLRGRSAINQGTGPGLTPIALGQIAGVENVTLLTSNLPPHTHTATATSALFGEEVPGTSSNPTGKLFASIPNGFVNDTGSPNAQLATDSITTSVAIGVTGSGLPVSIRNPYLGLNLCIATQGIFPSRQ